MYRKLLIAIDPEDDGEGKRAIEAAMELLADDGELHLASAYSPGGGGFFPHVTGEAPGEKEAEVRDTLDLLVRKYLPLNRNANLHVVAGSAGEKLVGLAGQLRADLMILVSRGCSGYWPLRRATVEYVSVNAPCRVLVLPSLEKAGPQAADEEGD
ncbi:nucleotide-binding universal stress UspA family protein [Onishia taeanensis]|uniref:Nucleotide-binding universal stress UspA family protein n=1 Tax=Onishia taeanensis TaxID=284577 RepID=A0A328XW84_9GAMM|nr:universal stress protein [Halomonas taeanensis]RAR61567.1 nucleotide-binding universal stress UspA family protein [Halomonas taeanensis]